MGHGLGSGSDSELSDAPPSPRLPPPTSSLSPPPHASPSPPQYTHSSATTEPPWKARPRPKRQPSTSVPNPPSSPKRRKRADRDKDTSGKGKDVAVKGKDAGGTKVKGAKAVGKVKLQVQVKDPSPEPKASTSTDEKASTSGTKAVSSAPWKRGGKTKVSSSPAPEIKPAPFATAAPKPKPTPASTVTSKPPFNTSKSTSSDLPRPAPSTKSAKPVPAGNKPTRTTKRPTYNESTDSSDEEHEDEPKRHKRRKSHVDATPKATRKPRPSLPAQPTPKAKAKPDPAPGALELRPASFLTKTASLSFMNNPPIPSTSLNLKPREDIWSYDDLTGLTWVKLDIHKCEIVPGNEQTAVLGEQWCWWPAEVKQTTTNGIKLALCGLGIERELGPCVAAETNILTFRKPNGSSVRFPTFKTAFSQPTLEAESPPAGEPSTSEASNQPTGEPSPNEPSTILPTSPSALETTWKQALACAFEIDTESNDGLVDIHLLFSQKSTTPREEDESSSNTALGDLSDEEEEDVLENGTTVLCRYRTRYYPAKIISYHPREGKARRRGTKGKYKCVFADDSTKVAARPEIMTTLDDGFATCPLGTYQRYGSHAYQKPTGVREPSPAPRASSPAPESEDCTIDPEEYCSRERMRDQLKPVLPFLKGLIERRYIPGRGAVEGVNPGDNGSLVKELGDSSPDGLSMKDSNDQTTGEESSDQTVKEPTDSPESVLDRHAVFMQGGRARKNLAYSVYTGDLNEDDCEELMFEISRWALRGERWACEERTGQESGEVMNQEGGEVTNLEGKEGQVIQQGESAGQEVQVGESTSQEAQMVAEPDAEGTGSKEPEPKTLEAEAPDTDVDMQDVNQESSAGQDSQLQTEAKSGDTTELEDELLRVVKIREKTPSAPGDFRSLVKLQPPRPIGAPDYEGLTPEERMGYVSDVLYPEAAALVLSYRRGIRTQPGPLADLAAEHALYTAGLQAAKNTCSTSDWVEQILAIRQLRQSNSKYQVEEQEQIVVAGGTRSRPKYMTSVLK